MVTRVIRPVGMLGGSKRVRPLTPPTFAKPPGVVDDGPVVEATAPVPGLRYRCVYGPPKAGVSTLLAVLSRATRTRLWIVETAAAAYDLDPLADGVVVVTPWPKSREDAAIIPAFGSPVAIRIDAEDRALAKRGALSDEVASWRYRFAEIESHLDFLCVPRATLWNVDLATAAAELARRLSLRD